MMVLKPEKWGAVFCVLTIALFTWNRTLCIDADTPRDRR